MPLDPARVAETRPWFEKASQDLRAAEHLRDADPPFLSEAAFHAQQAAEKAMKGFLVWHDRPFAKTHNLVELGRACTLISPDAEPVLRRASSLSEYAWRYRYPGDPGEPTVEETSRAMAIAREVVDALLAKLPEEVRPVTT